MISAEEARVLFATEEELKEKRINEVVNHVLSLFELYIIESAKEHKSVSIPILLGDLSYLSNYGFRISHKNIYIKRVGINRVLYNNGIKSDEYFEVIVRVFDRLLGLGYSLSMDIDELSVRDLNSEGSSDLIKISWE